LTFIRKLSGGLGEAGEYGLPVFDRNLMAIVIKTIYVLFMKVLHIYYKHKLMGLVVLCSKV